LAAIIVCFEGIDGSGKSTQVQRVARRLEASGRSVAILRAVSRESPFFSYLEAMIDVINRGTFCSIVAFNRYFAIEQLIARHRDEYDVLLFDRYLMTDISYTAGFGYPTEFAEELVRRVTSPDLTVLSEVPVDLAMERIGQRGSVLEFQENHEVLSGTAKSYHGLRVDGWQTLVVDGSGDMDGVTDTIYARILDLLAAPLEASR
jgi:dTMP kinase